MPDSRSDHQGLPSSASVLIQNRWLAGALAILGGLLLDVASPELAWWPVAFPAIALLIAPLWGRTFWAGALLGLLGGAAFWMPNIFWLTLYLGPVPWAALAAFMMFWHVVFGALIALVTRYLPRLFRHRNGVTLALLPVVLAGLWLAKETVAGSWPYGGFGWGRVAVTQSNGPLGALASWIGISGLSFVMVFLVSFILCAVALYRQQLVAPGQYVTAPRILVLAPVLLGLMLSVVPVYALPVEGTVRIGAVQGNTKSGIFDDRQPWDSINSHFTESLTLADSNVDLVVWPEGASDLDPNRVEDAASMIETLARDLDVPIVFGTITKDGDRYFNSSLVWEAGRGVVGQYDKKHPVPFAEYMPHRDFYHALAPDLVDMVQLEYTPGTRPATVDIGDWRVGLSICFDIVDDSLAREMVNTDAEFILAQTNNADFGHTDESVQQLAIAQLRAIETGRTVVNISTVGTSAVILPDGSFADRLDTHVPGTMVEDIDRVSGVTPGIAIGLPLQTILLIIAALGAVSAAVVAIGNTIRIRRTRNTSLTEKDAQPE
ncbi:apolipoprotein N-acyltransferase [Lysinibacter cavernae]|uniref:Apolipoprotein N-acyltransferase n=1 Tax=Lysinibacter cavernae TaxID=1640652 RepID=A0A7X5QZC1_9MICO|nr:apolipoprotein N-acyltransferase [Lysinibacter cavernae]NIH52785.1 apolipoprotein N-acyltransferase [Lysinibacter cavernae]